MPGLKDPIRSVAVLGGVHGNEATGAALARHWVRHPEELARPGLSVRAMVANPEAVDEGVRYIDRDLNRCFALEDLARDPDGHENGRAQQLNAKLGPKGAENPAVDLILDMHSATSPMGVTLIATGEDPRTMAIIARLLQIDPSRRCYLFPLDQGDAPYLRTVAPSGFGIEVGPAPLCNLRAEAWRAYRRAVADTLDAVAALNAGRATSWPGSLELYRHVADLDFPRDGEGRIAAMVHPAREGRNYEPLVAGEALFEDFFGNPLPYKGEPGLVPVFINESVYYEKGIALCLSRRETVVLET